MPAPAHMNECDSPWGLTKNRRMGREWTFQPVVVKESSPEELAGFSAQISNKYGIGSKTCEYPNAWPGSQAKWEMDLEELSKAIQEFKGDSLWDRYLKEIVAVWSGSYVIIPSSHAERWNDPLRKNLDTLDEVVASLATQYLDEAWFNERADRWEREAAIHSAPSARFAHKDYVAILAKGPHVAKFILKRLRKSKKDWCWALERIFDPEDPGKGINSYKGKVDAWLEWGKKHNII